MCAFFVVLVICVAVAVYNGDWAYGVLFLILAWLFLMAVGKYAKKNG
jgi:hypothetical protein